MAIVIENPRRRGLIPRLVRWLAFLVVMGTMGAIALAGGLYLNYCRSLPPIPPFDEYTLMSVSVVAASDGSTIGEFYDQKRYVVPYDKLPPHLVNAFLAAEDDTFFEHSGIDFPSVLRAIYDNIMAGKIVQGSSTITMQLATVLLGRKKTLEYKVSQAILARRIEDTYTKEQILLLYLNVVFLGNNSYGVQAAARNYFRKNVWDITVAEAAMIASCPQSPSLVNPVANLEKTIKRQRLILELMHKKGFITKEELDAALDEEVAVYKPLDYFGTQTPYFTTKALESLDDDFPGWRSKGMHVTTTVDPSLQWEATEALFDGLEDLAAHQSYKGPLAHVSGDDEATFLEKNGPYVPTTGPLEGERYLALVTKVDKTRVDITLDGTHGGAIPLASMSWAGTYVEYPAYLYRFAMVDGEVLVTKKHKHTKEVIFANQVIDPSKRFEIFSPKLLGKIIDKHLPEEGSAWTYLHQLKKGKVSFDRVVKDARKVLSVGDVILVRYEGPYVPPKKSKKKKKKPKALLPAGTPHFALSQRPHAQGAVVAFEPHSGHVKAMVGGWDFDASQHNRVFSVRQTGSLMKVVVYSLAYSLGLAPSDFFSGIPFREGDYNPTGDEVDADMTVWEGLVHSENAISLRVMKYVKSAATMAEYKGWGSMLSLTEPLEGNLAEVLGGSQSLWGMTSPFCIFSKFGKACPRTTIKKVVDGDGTILARSLAVSDPYNTVEDDLMALFDKALATPPVVMDPAVATMIYTNLTHVTTEGTAKKAKKLGIQSIGKTGTLPYDVWFIGATGDLVAGVWVGMDNYERILGESKKKSRVYGSSTPLPIWMDLMEHHESSHTIPSIEPPVLDTLVTVNIDPASGLLTTGKGIAMPHIKGTEPTQMAPEELPTQGYEQLMEQF